MAKTLSTGPFRVSGSFSHTNSTTLGGSIPYTDSVSHSITLTSGTGASKANLLYADLLTINAGATTNLDLAGGLSDAFGDSFSFALIKIIYIELTTTTASTSINVGGHATAAFGNWITSADTLDNDQPAVKVKNNGVFYLACSDASGYAVTATTDDILTLKNNDGAAAATVKIVLVGE